MHIANEMLDHFLRDFEVGDDAVPQRSDGLDVAGRTVILDASDTAKYPSGSVFYLYTPNLDHLSNDAENFGGLMTEVRIN